MGSCRILDRSGDITIGWTEDQDDEIAQVIQKKMDQGIRFFRVMPFSDENVQITRITDIAGREVRILDEDIERLFTEGRVGIFSKIATAARNVVTGSLRVTDAAQAASTDTMAVRQLAGG
jgi:hypothetical protein